MGFHIGANCKIHPSAVIQVESGFLGAGSIVNEGARIEGTRVEIGREAYIDRFATIGGGSAFDPDAFLVAGDWLHMGCFSQLNTARGIRVGHEFGCGIETKVFTHGAYLDSYNLGAPVQWAGVEIGDSVWMPNAWVNPGVRIGSNVIVAARSLVNRDIPSGSLAGGVPCSILKADYLPRALSSVEKKAVLASIIERAVLRFGPAQKNLVLPQIEGDRIHWRENGEDVVFDVAKKTMNGPVTPLSSLVKDQLRRNGIRFRFEDDQGQWASWDRSAGRAAAFIEPSI